jgi:hypothetical protein
MKSKLFKIKILKNLIFFFVWITVIFVWISKASLIIHFLINYIIQIP